MEYRRKAAPLALVLVMVLAGLATPVAGVLTGPTVDVTAADHQLTLGASTTVTVTVDDANGDPIELIRVNISAFAGSFDEDMKVTDASGQCTFTYTAPTVSGDVDYVTITASVFLPPDTRVMSSDTIYLRSGDSGATVTVQGPTVLVKGGPTQRYNVTVMAGPSPAIGTEVTVESLGVGVVEDVGGPTDVSGRTWFDLSPPSDATGDASVKVTAISKYTANIIKIYQITVVEEGGLLEVAVEADADPLPCWGSCNLTATVTRGGTPVEGAIVAFQVSKGWLEAPSSTTGTDGRASMAYTARNAGPGLWAGIVNVTATASSLGEVAAGVTTVSVAPYGAVFAADVLLNSTGGQLVVGDELLLKVDLVLEEGAAWEFITPYDVHLIQMDASGHELDRAVVKEGGSLHGPFWWTSGWQHILTVEAGAEPAVYMFDVEVVSPGGDHVYKRLPEPLRVDVTPDIADEWTFLVYVAGDNDLEGWDMQFLDYLETTAPQDGEFDVYVQIDRLRSSATYPWDGARRYRLAYGNAEGEIDSQLLMDMGEVDMGSASTLADFMLWASHLSPAGHYCLLIWDHGDVLSSCRDFHVGTSTDYRLHNTELASALETFKEQRRKLDVIVFDTCLMSSLNVVWRLNGLANYLVACETTTTADITLIDYLSRAEAFYPDSRPTPFQVATDVLGAFYVKMTPDGVFPYAAIDLGWAPLVFSAMDDLVDALIEQWDLARPVVYDASMHNAVESGEDARGFFSFIHDSLVANPQSEELDSAEAAAQAVVNDLDGLVIDSIPQGNCQGVSVHFPTNSASWEMDREECTSQGIGEDAGWTRLLDAFWFGVPGQGEGPSVHWPMDVSDYPGIIIGGISSSEDDDDGDGMVEDLSVNVSVNNAASVLPVTLVVDALAFNGTMGASIRGLVDRRYVTVPAGADREVEVSLTSPRVDAVEVVVRVLSEDGVLLEEQDAGEHMMNATPREGHPPSVSLTEGPVEALPGDVVGLETTVSDEDGDAVDVTWDLDSLDGIGIDANGTRFTTRYPGPRNYTVTCIVTDGTHYVVRQVDIVVGTDPDAQPPVANLTVQWEDEQTAVLNASGSSDPDGGDLFCSFVAGDGMWTTWGTGAVLEHRYADDGDYLAMVRVRGYDLDTVSYATVDVHVPGKVVNLPPVASLVVDPTSVKRGDQVVVNASASVDPEGAYLEYMVEWGDGTDTGWSREPLAEHSYDEAGTYTITLTVRDRTNTDDQTVDVTVEKGSGGNNGIPGAGVALSVLALLGAGCLAIKRPRVGNREHPPPTSSPP